MKTAVITAMALALMVGAAQAWFPRGGGGGGGSSGVPYTTEDSASTYTAEDGSANYCTEASNAC